MPFTPNTPEDLENLSDSELKIGYWLAQHRLKLRQIFFWILAVFDILLLGFSLWQWGSYIFSGYFKDKILLQEIARPRSDAIVLQEHFAARPLQIQTTQIFSSPGDKADALAVVKNPNDQFAAQFDYDFDWGGGKTALRLGFILPGEEKPIVELGMAGTAGASQIILEIKNLRWQRFTPHQIKDMNEYLAKHLNFTTGNVSLNNLERRLSFSLSNETIYSYFEPRFIILLLSNGEPVGAEQVFFNNLLAGEKKLVDLRLLNQNVFASEIKVIADINIFDPGVYIK